MAIPVSQTPAPTDPDPIAQRVAALGEWFTGFTLNGKSYGSTYFAERDTRVWPLIKRLQASARQPASILECACFEGGHTTLLSREFPNAQIRAVEVRPESLAKARLLAELRGCRNIEFIQDDLDEPKVTFDRNYDVIMSLGLLYHLRWPERFLESACKASPMLWLQTHYCPEVEASAAPGRLRGRIHHEPTEHYLSGVRPESVWLTLEAMFEVLWGVGYTGIELIGREYTPNGAGPAILLCATR
jgi:hypothetical protein